MSIRVLIPYILLVCIVFYSCDDDDPTPIVKTTPDTALHNTIFDIMHEWYLWNDKLPDSINSENFESGQELIDYLKYSEFNKNRYNIRYKNSTA